MVDTILDASVAQRLCVYQQSIYQSTCVMDATNVSVNRARDWTYRTRGPAQAAVFA